MCFTMSHRLELVMHDADVYRFGSIGLRTQHGERHFFIEHVFFGPFKAPHTAPAVTAKHVVVYSRHDHTESRLATAGTFPDDRPMTSCSLNLSRVFNESNSSRGCLLPLAPYVSASGRYPFPHPVDDGGCTCWTTRGRRAFYRGHAEST